MSVIARTLYNHILIGHLREAIDAAARCHMEGRLGKERELPTELSAGRDK